MVPYPMAATWTRDVRANAGGAGEVVIVRTEGSYNHDTTRAVEGFIQAHDPHGRALYDAEGRPVLVPWQQQKAHTSAVVIGVWVLVVLQVAAVIAGIVGAVALHDMGGLGY